MSKSDLKLQFSVHCHGHAGHSYSVWQDTYDPVTQSFIKSKMIKIFKMPADANDFAKEKAKKRGGEFYPW